MPAPKHEKPLDRKVFPFEVKAVDVSESVFSGYSAAIGNRDLGNDIIEPGAFEKTIAERVAAGNVKLLDNHNSFSTQDVWGTVTDAEEVKVDVSGDNAPTHKLLTEFQVSRADESAQTALRKIEEGHLNQLSIGFRPLKTEFEADEGEEDKDPRVAWIMGDGVRRIKEIQWWETSLVIWAMNPEAQILANSVGSLMDFARKAASSGVKVPEETVRETIEALSMLTGERCPSSGPTDEVHKAVGEIRRTLEHLERAALGDENDRLRSLAEDYAEIHGEPEAAKFVAWVVDSIEEKTEVEEEDKEDPDVPEAEEVVEEVEKKDEEEHETPEDPEAVEEDETEDPEEVKSEDDEDDEEEGETAALNAVVDGLLKAVNQLTEALDAAEAAETEDLSDEDEEVDADGHVEEEETAKDADAAADEAEDEGRTEHLPAGEDELATELEALKLLRLRDAA